MHFLHYSLCQKALDAVFVWWYFCQTLLNFMLFGIGWFLAGEMRPWRILYVLWGFGCIVGMEMYSISMWSLRICQVWIFDLQFAGDEFLTPSLSDEWFVFAYQGMLWCPIRMHPFHNTVSRVILYAMHGGASTGILSNIIEFHALLPWMICWWWGKEAIGHKFADTSDLFQEGKWGFYLTFNHICFESSECFKWIEDEKLTVWKWVGRYAS